jgi:hypothetical protein
MSGFEHESERINQVEPLVEQMRTYAIVPSPPVVQFDGIWVTIQSAGEKIKPDSKKRNRKQRTGKKQGILVALAFWEDGRRARA